MMLVPYMIKECSTIYETCMLYQLTTDNHTQQINYYFIFVIIHTVHILSTVHIQFITMGTLFIRSIQRFSDLCTKVLCQ